MKLSSNRGFWLWAVALAQQHRASRLQGLKRTMPLEDIFGRPPARRRLIICTGPCCNRTGEAEAFVEGLRDAMRSCGLDEAMIGEASCMRRSCLGKCTGEPLALIDPDGIWYHNLSVENLLLILRDHLLFNRPVAKLILEEDT